jgi:type VI secretion system protein VasJ
MLGSIEADQSWRFAAFGKHPVTGDYFTLGKEFALGKGFSTWVEQGYQLVNSNRQPLLNLYSWRFWTRSFQRKSLACGLVRDSSDSVGRPYPILIMGMGPLNGWENDWDLLPLACERTWTQMESISTRVFSDVKYLQDEIELIKPPHSQWSELIKVTAELREVGRLSHAGEPSVPENKINRMISMAREVEVFIPLEETPHADHLIEVHHFHSLFKTQGAEIPTTVFMGGNQERNYLALFRRPLVAQDFGRLWSIGSARAEGGK